MSNALAEITTELDTVAVDNPMAIELIDVTVKYTVRSRHLVRESEQG